MLSASMGFGAVGVYDHEYNVIYWISNNGFYGRYYVGNPSVRVSNVPPDSRDTRLMLYREFSGYMYGMVSAEFRNSSKIYSKLLSQGVPEKSQFCCLLSFMDEDVLNFTLTEEEAWYFSWIASEIPEGENHHHGGVSSARRLMDKITDLLTPKMADSNRRAAVRATKGS